MIRSLEDIKLITELGNGACGKVYLARPKSNENENFALKVVKKPSNPVDANLLKNEIKIFQNVKSPFLCEMQFCFETSEKVYFGLELMYGDLIDLIPMLNYIDEKNARFYLAETTLALEHLHKQNVLYRDLKPENILIAKDGHIKLTDFGLSEFNFTKNSKTTTLCGTLEFLAPEIIKGEPYGFEIDLWALGVLAYGMLTGRRPFHGGTRNMTKFRIRNSVVEVPSHLSSGAQDLIKGLLKRNIEERLDISGVKNSSFFDGVCWDKVLVKGLEPPYIPRERNFKASDPMDSPCKNSKGDYERFIDLTDHDVKGDGSESEVENKKATENEKPVCRRLGLMMSNLNINH